LIPADFIPIPGTRHIKYLKENAGAASIELSKEENEEIRKTIEKAGGRKGERYPVAFLSSLFGDSAELGSEEAVEPEGIEIPQVLRKAD